MEEVQKVKSGWRSGCALIKTMSGKNVACLLESKKLQVGHYLLAIDFQSGLTKLEELTPHLKHSGMISPCTDSTNISLVN